MRQIDFTPYRRSTIGFDRLFDLLETSVQRTVVRVEDALMHSGRFTLPGRPALRGDETVWSVVLVDATEVPCERPQGGNVAGTAARKSGIP